MAKNEKKMILIDPRAYNYMKKSAITNIEDALVELITNSDDAYDKGKMKEKKMDIEINYNTRCIIFRDYAIGLTGEGMEKCFLQVGHFTSDSKSRGFFSRGSKDISSIGNIIFEAVKDNKYSRVDLDTESYGTIVEKDIDATTELREKTKLTENGLVVTIELMEKINIPSTDFLAEGIPKLASLRDIFSNKKNNIILKGFVNDKLDSEHKLSYEYPGGDVIMEVSYVVPGYDDAEATFKLYKTEEPFERTAARKYQEFGLLIKSQKVIHDIDSFDHELQFDPDIQYFWGVLESPYINKLMRDFDFDSKSKKNPFPIIDPNRIQGIAKNHPFYRALIQLPLKRVKLILEEMDNLDENKDHQELDISQLSNLLDELELSDPYLYRNHRMKNKIVADSKGKLIRAIESERSKIVKVEKNFFMNMVTEQDNKGKKPFVFNRLDAEKEKTMLKETDDKDGDDMKLDVYERSTVIDDPENESKLRAENKSVRLKIVFKNDKRRDYKFEIKKTTETVKIKINISHHVIRDFFPKEKIEISEISPAGLIVLESILTDSFTRLLMQNEALTDKNRFEGLSTEEVLENFIRWKEKKEKIVEKIVHSVIKKIINQKNKKK